MILVIMDHRFLIECGFLSNKNEREKLTNDKYLREYAKVVAKTFLKI